MKSEPMARSFWRALAWPEGLRGQWNVAASSAWPLVQPWLTLTDRVAEECPCPRRPPCRCLHEFIQTRHGWFARCVCQPRECAPTPVNPADRMIWRWDYPRFLAGLRAALQLESLTAARESAPASLVLLGGAPTRQPVFFAPLPFSAPGPIADWSQALHSRPDAILLTPLGAAQPRALALADVLRPGPGGRLLACEPPATFWTKVTRQLGEPASATSTLLKDLRAAVGRLNQAAATATQNPAAPKLAQEVMALAQRIDPQSFQILCAVLSSGDVAKASRRLGLPDSTLRATLAGWRRRGPTYATMLELIRWRKRIGRKETVHLDPALFRAPTPATDHAGLLADVLESLLEMTDENWRERTDELAGLLRPYAQEFRGDGAVASQLPR